MSGEAIGSIAQTDPSAAPLRQDLSARFRAVRTASRVLTRGLTAEDQQVQSAPEVSPTKWHLAHTTWFFETFLLNRAPGYRPFDPHFGFLFNSYYEASGPRLARAQRGLISRPGLEDVLAYRAHVDTAMEAWIEACPRSQWPATRSLMELGLQHEEQHQELILMDIKHVLSCNPLAPAFAPAGAEGVVGEAPEGWLSFDGGIRHIGAGDGGFCFDNERPCHRIWLEPFRLQGRLVTAREWVAFIDDGGYRRPEFWLSDGWALVSQQGWEAPLYWRRVGEAWVSFTLHGERPVRADEPVCHVSYYEADAYARWRGLRLPTEAEWETAAVQVGAKTGHERRFHPSPARPGDGLRQMFGEVWQWTASPYVAYPGYRPLAGALGEYNGKFMSNQMVLRGGACITPPGHARATYRNFFPPAARWAFGGVRLADND